MTDLSGEFTIIPYRDHFILGTPFKSFSRVYYLGTLAIVATFTRSEFWGQRDHFIWGAGSLLTLGPVLAFSPLYLE